VNCIASWNYDCNFASHFYRSTLRNISIQIYSLTEQLFNSKVVVQTRSGRVNVSFTQWMCLRRWNSGLALLPACYRNIIITCFNEEIKASHKNCTVNRSALCFLYNIFFLCYFYSRCLYCFNQSLYCFLRKKVDGLKRAGCTLGGCEKNRLLLLTLTFITNTKH